MHHDVHNQNGLFPCLFTLFIFILGKPNGNCPTDMRHNIAAGPAKVLQTVPPASDHPGCLGLGSLEGGTEMRIVKTGNHSQGKGPENWEVGMGREGSRIREWQQAKFLQRGMLQGPPKPHTTIQPGARKLPCLYFYICGS